MNGKQQAAGMTFPCAFQVKAMGLAEPGFDALVVEIVRRHCDDIREGAVSSKPSKNGKYVSVTVGFQAESMDQLNAIYDELTAHEKVLMRL
jgi:putative lipoic acid-binding regulatory protein